MPETPSDSYFEKMSRYAGQNRVEKIKDMFKRGWLCGENIILYFNFRCLYVFYIGHCLFGSKFEELKAIIDSVELSEKLGVCLDTCHVNDGGYDVVNNLDGVLEEFDRVIGIERLCAIHINDSKNPFASHKDRHEKIGDGNIGIEAFERIK